MLHIIPELQKRKNIKISESFLSQTSYHGKRHRNLAMGSHLYLSSIRQVVSSRKNFE